MSKEIQGWLRLAEVAGGVVCSVELGQKVQRMIERGEGERKTRDILV
jgi:hypothetical protein